MNKYIKVAKEALNASAQGEVVAHRDGVIFRCPCNERNVYVASPPHEIAFDDDGLLTLTGSCGYAERVDLGRPANWCHFFIKNGEMEMCPDSQCPGSEL